MQIQINLSNKWLYSLMSIFILALVGVFVYAQFPGGVGHQGDAVFVTIDGTSKSLQQAIDDGDLISSEGGTVAPITYTEKSASYAILEYVDDNTIRIKFPGIGSGWSDITKDLVSPTANTLYLVGINNTLSAAPTANDIQISTSLSPGYQFIGSVRIDSANRIEKFVMPQSGVYYYANFLAGSPFTYDASSTSGGIVDCSGLIPAGIAKTCIVTAFLEDAGVKQLYVTRESGVLGVQILETSSNANRAQTSLSVPVDNNALFYNYVRQSGGVASASRVAFMAIGYEFPA